MERVLITGVAGFIGSHLADYFLDKGFDVVGVDNFITGNPRNIAHLKEHPRFRFIEHDVTRPLEVSDKIDYVLHFASPASPEDYRRIPIQTLKVGAMGAHNMLGLAKAHKARILMASTSEVYGDPEVHPQSEDYWGHVNPVGPRSMYDEAKRFQEALTVAYRDFHGVDTRIVRIFNTYGPRMRLNDGRVVPNFMGQILRGENLTVYGDGSQTRSFCYIDDQVEGIYRLLMSDYKNPVNIGNPDEVSILELARELLELSGRKDLQIDFKPLPKDDPKRRCPDISLARRLLDWEPRVDRKTGLRKTFEYFRSLPQEEWDRKTPKDFEKYIKR
ncbi:MAG: SDR family oxidoreductase [Chlorobi bacterium]|nr:SDR family oxidoreductase [Chlorobiota bacterium]